MTSIKEEWRLQMCHLSVFTVTSWWCQPWSREPLPAGRGSRKSLWTLDGQGGSLTLHVSSREKAPQAQPAEFPALVWCVRCWSTAGSLWIAQQLCIEFLLTGGDALEPTQSCPDIWQATYCHLLSMLKFFQFFLGCSNRAGMLPYKHLKFVAWMVLFGLVKFFVWLLNKRWHFHPQSKSPFVTRYVDYDSFCNIPDTM